MCVCTPMHKSACMCKYKRLTAAKRIWTKLGSRHPTRITHIAVDVVLSITDSQSILKMIINIFHPFQNYSFKKAVPSPAYLCETCLEKPHFLSPARCFQTLCLHIALFYLSVGQSWIERFHSSFALCSPRSNPHAVPSVIYGSRPALKPSPFNAAPAHHS